MVKTHGNDHTKENQLVQVVSPNRDDEGLWIHQDAWFYLGHFRKEHSQNYAVKKKGNGIYLYVIEGDLKVNQELLGPRDGIGISGANELFPLPVVTLKQ
jgi:redox-sensitive bicupin YhaK (pirin superfamily)